MTNLAGEAFGASGYGGCTCPSWVSVRRRIGICIFPVSDLRPTRTGDLNLYMIRRGEREGRYDVRLNACRGREGLGLQAAHHPDG